MFNASHFADHLFLFLFFFSNSKLLLTCVNRIEYFVMTVLILGSTTSKRYEKNEKLRRKRGKTF